MSAPHERDSAWHVWAGRVALAVIALLAVRDARRRRRRSASGPERPASRRV